MPDDDTTTTPDTTEHDDTERDPTTSTDAGDSPAPDAGDSPDAAIVEGNDPAPVRTARARSRPARPSAGSAPGDSDDTAAPADGAEAAAAQPAVAPRKRAPRKSASRRRAAAAADQPASAAAAADQPASAAAAADQPVTEDAPERTDEPDEALTSATPEVAAPELSTPAAEPVPDAEVAAAPRARAARASSGFALLTRAAPVFSHSPTPTPTPTPASDSPAAGPAPEQADAAAVTPESLLAALDAVAPPTGGRPPAVTPPAPPVPVAPVFVPPMPVFVDPADYWSTSPGAAQDAEDDEDDEDDEDGTPTDSATEDAATEDDGEGGEDTAGAATGPRRRRRRGGRRRRGSADRADEDAPGGTARTGGAARGDQPTTDAGDATGGGRSAPAAEGGPGGADLDEAVDDHEADRAPGSADEDDEGSDGEGTGEGVEDGASGSRRRRRRRRRGADDGDTPTVDDPPDTVVRVREPRRPRVRREEGDSEVTAARGSTRIEAKKQRRRDGREARKRPPILSEAEFLARRESVARSMLVRDTDGRTQIAVLEDGMLVEHYIGEESAPTDRSLIGDVYLGRVQNVLPAMEAAFIDIGRGRNAVLYAGEVDWDGLGMEGKPKRIELALKSGQSVLVQVTKDPIGQKGARLTAQVSLAGRYLVLVPNGSMSGISRKLPDAERSRLKKILRELLPARAGVIVRTAAEGATEEELSADVARLTGQWAEISAQAATASAPALLQGEPNLATKVVRDIFNEDFTSLVVSGDKVLTQIRSYIGSVAPNLLERVSAWTSEQDLFAANRVDEQLVKALDRKVFLPSGGSLVIDRTEAMTVVDVNTGRFTGSGGNLEETVTENNLEAAEELVRQLRLRDIGGIIVVDFIDMVFEANRDLVVRRLVECLGRDRTRHQVAEVSSLGLVQMTRKRIGRGLLEVFGRQCETCRGRGMVVDLNAHGISDHEGAPSGPGGPPRIPNPGNTGRAHLRTIVSAIPVGDLPPVPADTDQPDTDQPDTDQVQQSDLEILTDIETLEVLAGADPDLEAIIVAVDSEDTANPDASANPDDSANPEDSASPGESAGPADSADPTPDPADRDDGLDRDLAVVVTGPGAVDSVEES